MRFSLTSLSIYVLSPVLLSITFAKPIVSPISDIDYSPPITSPTSGDIFTAGEEIEVTWDTSLPSGISEGEVGQTAGIWLAWLEPNDITYHDTTELASNVSLYSGPTPGSALVTLPDETITRDSYIIVLIGSSGDKSAEFTINAD